MNMGKKNSSVEENFMGVSRYGVSQFQFLINWNLETFYGGSQVEFLKKLDDKIESRFQESYGIPSVYRTEGRMWLSTSALSRWLSSNLIQVQITMISYLGESELLRFPGWLFENRTVNTADIVNILLGKMKIDAAPERQEK
jgi:hypothetical protein